MQTTRSVVFCSLTSLHLNPNQRSETFCFNPIWEISTSKHKNGCCFLGAKRSLQYLSISHRARSDNKMKMDFAVYSNVQPGASLPSGPPPNSLKNWILGALLTILLPFLGHKLGPVLKLTKRVEAAVETAEHMAEAVEKVAEEAEKMAVLAEKVVDILPEGQKLEKALTFVENTAKETAKMTDLAEEFIDKVESVEERVELVEEKVESVEEKVDSFGDEQVIDRSIVIITKEEKD